VTALLGLPIVRCVLTEDRDWANLEEKIKGSAEILAAVIKPTDLNHSRARIEYSLIV
jgi:hypothetical protein